MRIYTSYVASAAPLHRKVLIAKYCKFWNGVRAPLLAPEYVRCDQWQLEYIRTLNKRFSNAVDILCYIQECIAGAIENPILVGHEKNLDNCHRLLLADIIFEHTGVDIPEWKPEVEIYREEQCLFVSL